MWVALAFAKATHSFSAKTVRVYAIFRDQSFNNTLTNDIVCFEQLCPGRVPLIVDGFINSQKRNQPPKLRQILIYFDNANSRFPVDYPYLFAYYFSRQILFLAKYM